VAHGIQSRGDRAFLAVVATNASAVRLYRNLGFAYRRDVTFGVFRAPA
jgi:predicted GNAT family acetyltransferase